MKKGEKFQIDQAWWKKAKDATIPSTGLGAVMGKYAELRVAADRAAKSGKYSSDEDVAALGKAHDLLHTTLPAAVTKAIKACNKTLHKTVLDCLQTTVNPVLKAERDFIDGCQDSFDKKYAAFSKPIVDRIKEIHQSVADYKQQGHTIFKDAEATLVKAEALVKKTEAAAKKAPIKEETIVTLTNQLNDFVSDMLQSVEQLEQIASAAKEDRDELLSLRTQNKTDLSPAHTSALGDGFSRIDAESTTINSYHDRAAACWRQGQSHMVAWQKFTGKAPPAETPAQVAKRLNRISADLDNLEKSGREYNNNMIAWKHKATKMISEPEMMEKAEGVTRDKFAELMQSWIDRSIQMSAKGVKLSQQARKTAELIVGRVPKTMKKDPLLESPLEQISEAVTALKAYVDVRNPAAIADLKTLKAQVAKKYAAKK